MVYTYVFIGRHTSWWEECVTELKLELSLNLKSSTFIVPLTTVRWVEELTLAS